MIKRRPKSFLDDRGLRLDNSAGNDIAPTMRNGNQQTVFKIFIAVMADGFTRGIIDDGHIMPG